MKFPKMNKQPKRVVGIPTLQGGVNLRDALNMCADNQLTDSVNMWFKDGVLKTRPGKSETLNYIHSATPDNANISWDERTDEKHIHSDVRKVENGKTYIMVSFFTKFKNYRENGGNAKSSYYCLVTFWVTDDGNEVIGGNDYSGDKKYFEAEVTNYFITATPKGTYLFVKYWDYGGEIFKYNNGWESVPETEMYAPLVKIGGTAFSEGVYYDQSVQYEGFNLLGCYYRMTFYSKDINQNSNKMKYALLFDSSTDDGSPFEEMEITATLNGVTHSAIYDSLGKAWEGDSRQSTDDGYFLYAEGDYFGFRKGRDATDYATIPDSWPWAEDLEVKAPCNISTIERAKVFSMTKTEWFGGSSEGINGGTRLFLGGSTNENEKSLMIWSGLNDPLYFPENCYSYVGNSLSAVKGFGKQEDMLVIFKENEMYYTKYAQNSNITGEDLANQSVVDYAASSVYFPLVQINPNIGCLSADTIKLCRNRLVWLGQDKKVYTLTGANQYSERNVFCVSEMIDRKLKKISDLKNAYALDVDGYYMLIIGENAYLMDYNSYGYQYIYSYQKAEDANLKIPWYIWETVSDNYSLLFNSSDVLCCVSYKYANENKGLNNGSSSELKVYTFTADNDNGQPIISMAQTKFFDFGVPNHRKNIEAVGVSFGNNGGETIAVQFITESGEEFTNINLFNDDTDSRNVGYIKSRILYPSIRSAVRFGVKFMCEGNMAIEGLNITYRTLGGAR